MRIAYLTDEPLPSTDTSTVQLVHTLEALSRAGADVDLFFPVAPADRRADPERHRAALRAQYHVEPRFGLRPLPGLVGDWRIGVKMAEAALGTVAALRGAYDVVYTRNVLPILPVLAAGRPLLFETYRPLTRQVPLVRGPLRRVARHRRFLGLITHSRYSARAFVEDGLPAEKVETIYNGFDAGAFSPQRTPAEARAALGLAEGPTVVYTGRIAPLKKIELLLDAAAAMPEVRWVLAGEHHTPEARPYAERARTLPNVTLTGYLTGERLVTALQAGDVLVIPPSAEPLERFGNTVLPIKVFNYLAAGRAILTGDTADTAELLEHDRHAWRVAPDQPAALLAGLRALLGDDARRARLAAGAAALAADLSWDARARRVLAFIERRLAAL